MPRASLLALTTAILAAARGIASRCGAAGSAAPVGRRARLRACCSTPTTAIRTAASSPIGSSARSRPACRWPSSRTWSGSAIRAAASSRSILSHGEPFTGTEPSLANHFFERIRPLVEQALRERQARDLAAHRPQPRSEDQRAGAPRRDLGDARHLRGVADDGAARRRRSRARRRSTSSRCWC